MHTHHRYFAAWPLAKDAAIEFPNGSAWDKSLLPEWRYPLSVLARQKLEFRTAACIFT